MSHRDLGSLFDEEGQGATLASSEGPRPSRVDEPLINDEARQMLEERSRAAREAAARAAEVAAQKSKELGKAALGALSRMKEEHQRRAQAKAEAKTVAREVVEPERGEGFTIAAPMSVSVAFASGEEANEALLDVHRESVESFAAREPVAAPADVVEEAIERPADRSTPAQIDQLARKRSYKYVWIAGGVLALGAAGNAAYWWSTKETSEPVAPPKVEATPVVKQIQPSRAPVIELPIAAPAPVEEVAPEASPVEVAPSPVVESKPEPFAKPAPKAEPARVVADPKPTPTPRPQNVEPAQAAAPAAPPKEEQQIEQIRDFGKQLDALGKR